MKQRTAYECEFCGNLYMAKDACEECEALHYGLTRREYLDWRMLNRAADNAGKRMGYCKSKTTINDFNRTIQALVDFEERHGIKNDCKKPMDFYF